jgi:hypothetical protein
MGHIENCEPCRERLASLDTGGKWLNDKLSPARAAGLANGSKVGGYVVLEKVAAGGQGAVYRAHDAALGRDVALKLSTTAISQDSAETFRAEARAHAGLTHPHITPLYSFGEHQGRPFFVMELAWGSLSGELGASRGPGSADEAALLVEQLAEAVEYAHRAGVHHRDLKPQNVLLTLAGEGNAWQNLTAKLTDFGLAGAGELAGSPNYIAPEVAVRLLGVPQAQPTPLLTTNATTAYGGILPDGFVHIDVYGLGAILHEVLTGQPPYTGKDRYDVVEAVACPTGKPLLATPNVKCRFPVPEALREIALKCLARDPAQRYPSAAAVADDLRRFRGRQLTSAYPKNSVVRLAWWIGLWCRRQPGWAALLAAVLLLAIGGPLAALKFYDIAQERDTQRQSAENERNAKEKQRARAVELAAIARKSFRDLASPIKRKPLAALTNEERARPSTLKDALAFFKASQQELESRKEFSLELASTQRLIGDVLQLLGRNNEAEKAYEKAEAVLKKLERPGEGLAGALRERAQLDHNLGNLYRSMKNEKEALKRFKAAADSWEGLVKKYGGQKEDRHEQALTLAALGDLRHSLEDEEEAKKARGDYLASLELLRALAKEFPREREFRRDLGRTCEDWADTYDQEDGKRPADGANLKEAAEHYDEGAQVFDALAQEDPSDLDAREAQERLRTAWANALSNTRPGTLERYRQAEALYRCARKLTRARCKEFASVLGHNHDEFEANESLRLLAVAYIDLAEDLEDEEADQADEAGVALLRELAADKSYRSSHLLTNLIEALLARSDAYLEDEDFKEAEQTCYAALKELGTGKDAERVRLRRLVRGRLRQVAAALRNQGLTMAANQRWEEARTAYKAAEAAVRRMSKECPHKDWLLDLATTRSSLGQALAMLAVIYNNNKYPQKARHAYEEAGEAYRKGYANLLCWQKAAKSPETVTTHLLRARLAFGLAMSHAGVEKWKAAREPAENALKHLEQVIRLSPNAESNYGDLYLYSTCLSTILLKQGNHRALAKAASGWYKAYPNFSLMHQLACRSLAHCVTLAREDKGLSVRERSRLVEDYSKDTVAALRVWVQVYYDKPGLPLDPALLRKTDFLKPVFDYEGFKEFEKERKAPKKSQTKP